MIYNTTNSRWRRKVKTGLTVAMLLLAATSVLHAEQFPIAVGDTVAPSVPGAGAGEILVSTNVDYYTFSGTAGQAIFLEEVSVSSTFQGWLSWDLKTPGGATLMSAYFEGTDEGRRVLPETGTYTIRVRVGANNPAYVGTYSFRVWGLPPDPVFGIQIGDTVTNNLPAAGAGNIELPGAQDIYQFNATAGQLAFFEILGTAAAFKGWLKWELKTPSGQTVFTSFMGSANEGRKMLPETGTYQLRLFVGSTDSTMTGTYGFRIRAIPADQSFAVALGQVVSNGVPGPGAGNIEVPGAQDTYTFQGVAGQAVFFQNISVASSLGGWLHWQVKTPSGQSLFVQFFGATSVGRKTLPETGVGSSRVDLQACKLEYSIVSPK